MHKSLDIYDILPEDMRRYLSSYGFHFNKKAFEMATKMMKKKNAATGKMDPIQVVPKETVDSLMESMAIKVENNILYDAAYVFNMGKADHYGSAIEDDRHMARFVKDTLDDPDGSGELPFRYWLQKMVALGTPVNWEELL